MREEICTKNIIIETLLENQKVSQTQNFNETLKLNTQKDNYIKQKNVIKNKDVKKQDNGIKINNRFEALKDDFNDNYNNTHDPVGNNVNIENTTKQNQQRKSVKTPPRRPSVVINHHPENQTDFKSRTVPDSPSKNVSSELHANENVNLDCSSTSTDKKLFIFSDSIPKAIKMRDFNKHTTDWGKATLKAFPGATTK